LRHVAAAHCGGRDGFLDRCLDLEGYTMTITITNTTSIAELEINGTDVPARLWEGQTASGIPVHCYIVRIGVHESQDCAQFERELQEQRKPSFELAAIPLRLIL
jgi:hypothetical protein